MFKVTDNRYAIETPTSPYEVPKIAISNRREIIVTNNEMPILVDFWACNLALIMDEIVNGIKDKLIICNEKIPSL